jgi:nucleoside-diphosphate-sugar epimerase
VTKLAAEGLCRLHFLEFGLNCVVLRTGRFFPEEDDIQLELSGPNLKANKFLNRRLTVEDAADAHVVALDRAPALGFEIFVLSAPTPFVRSEAEELKRAAANVIVRYFPDAPALYARRGWQLPTSIGRVYDASRIERVMGFRCATDFGRVLHALRTDGELPYAHEPAYRSPKGSPAVS